MPTRSEPAEVSRRGRSSGAKVTLLLLLLQQTAITTAAVLLTAKGRKGRETLRLLRVKPRQVRAIARGPAEGRVWAIGGAKGLMRLLLLLALLIGRPH